MFIEERERPTRKEEKEHKIKKIISGKAREVCACSLGLPFVPLVNYIHAIKNMMV